MEDDLDKIIVGFYSAAAGALGWRRALLPMKQYFQAWAVQVVGLEVDRAAVKFSYEVGDAPAECTVDYVRTYHRHDPRARMVMALSPNEWLSCHEHFNEEFVATNRFYQEFLLPYGGRYTSGTKLLQDGSETVLLGIMRGRDSRPLGLEELAEARRLARHLGEALKLDRAGRARAPQMSLGMALLGRIGAPILLLDERRGLRYANPAAVELLELKDGLLVRDGALACASTADQSTLTEVLDALQLGSAEAAGPDQSQGRRFCRVHRSSRVPLGLYVYAVRPSRTLSAFGGTPLAMVVIHDPAARPGLDPFVVAASFDLTPAEAKVAVALAGGMAIKEIAVAHRVSVNTIRTQMNAVLSKTGAARQAELVSIISALPVSAFKLS